MYLTSPLGCNLSHVSGGWVSWPSCITLGKRDCIFTVQFYQTVCNKEPSHPGHHTLWLQLESDRLASKCCLQSWVGQFWKNLSPLLVSSFCECLCLNILFRFITLSWHLLNVGKSLFIVMLVNTWLPFYSQNQRKDSPNLFSDIASWASRKNLVVYQGSIPYFWVEDIYKPPLLTFWFNSGNYLVQKWLAYAQRYSKSVMYFWNGYDRFLCESCSATQCYSKC